MTTTTPSLAELEAQYNAAFDRRDLRACTDLLIQIWTMEATEDFPVPDCFAGSPENDNASR